MKNKTELTDNIATDFYFSEEEVKFFTLDDQKCIACKCGNWEGQMGLSSFNLGQKYSEVEIIKINLNGKRTIPGNLMDEVRSKVIANFLINLQNISVYPVP